MRKIFSIISYVIASLLVLIYGLVEVIPHGTLSELGRLFLLCGSCVFLYFGGLLLSRHIGDNRPMKINLWLFFVLYLVLLITLTLFDPMWGRSGISFVNWDWETFRAYLDSSVNIIPFRTIVGYLKEFDSLYSTNSIMFNLLGNLVALMPMAFFLPFLFKKENNFKTFLITIIIIVLGIELVQLVTASGSCDIDDVILNTTGSVIMYLILKIKSVDNLLKNIFLLEKNKINKKEIITILIMVFGCILFGLGLIKYRENLYDNNLENHMNKYNPTIEIVDESVACEQTLEEFYEDDYFKYYFPCVKSEYVYAIINKNEKYLVKEILNNNPTEYKIDIRKITDKLELFGVNYLKENKYQYIAFKVVVPGSLDGVIASPRESVTVVNDEILTAEFDQSKVQFIRDEYTINLHLIPKKSGQTTMMVEFRENGTNEIIEIYNYLVKIDDKLNVVYQEIN